MHHAFKSALQVHFCARKRILHFVSRARTEMIAMIVCAKQIPYGDASLFADVVGFICWAFLVLGAVRGHLYDSTIATARQQPAPRSKPIVTPQQIHSFTPLPLSCSPHHDYPLTNFF
jgi:hypothetical protein